MGRKSSKSRSRRSQGNSDDASPAVTPVGKKGKKGNKSKHAKTSKSRKSRSKTPNSKKSSHHKRSKKSKSKTRSSSQASSSQGSDRLRAGAKTPKRKKMTKSSSTTRSSPGTDTGGDHKKKKKHGSRLCGAKSKKSKSKRSKSASKSEKKSHKSSKKARSKKSKASKRSKKSKKSKKEKSKGGVCGTPKRSKKSKKSKHDKKPAESPHSKPTSSSAASATSGQDDEKGLMTCSYWQRAASKKNANRMIVIMRSAERVDRLFGKEWLTTEAPHGYLTPTDLNVQNNLQSKKFLHDGVFKGNSPITSFGKYSTQLTARALANRGIKSKLIICSPTLRAIQTADALAKFMKAKIAVEPGLVEPLAWYRAGGDKIPDFHLDEMAKEFPINTDYVPVMSMDSVTKSFDSETEMQGLGRVDFVLRSLAGEQRSEALIVVAHAITLAAASALAYPQKENEQKQKTASDGTASPITSFDWHQSVDMLEGDVVDQVNLGLRFPPGSVMALNQVNKGPPFLYQLTPGVVPPLSYGESFTNSAIVEA